MWREFRFARSKTQAPLVWKIKQDGASYSTTHGILGGAMQDFSDTPGDKGKVETKAYVNAVDNCAFHMEREIRKKVEHGYVEWVDGKPVTEQVSEIRFDKALPKNFCSYKPQTDIDSKALEKLHKTGKARYTRKYDGMCHLAVHHKTGWEIYTRRMDLATDKFPNHIKELEYNDKFDVGTILIGEAVCSKPDGTDDFKAVSRFCRSLPEEARKLVEDKEIPEPEYIVFDIIFFNGKDLKDTCYDDRSKHIKTLPGRFSNHLVNVVDYFDVTPSTWEQTAKRNQWEGFVVTDGAAVPGDKFYSFHGDAKRPKGHHKLKPLYEEDVVIYAIAKGSGKCLNTVGAAFIKQRYPEFYPGTSDLHPQAGEWFDCGKVGSGFDGEGRKELEHLCLANNIPIVEDGSEVDINTNDGLVSMIEYGERQPGSQKFRFPVFVRVRFDKTVAECVAQRLAISEDS